MVVLAMVLAGMPAGAMPACPAPTTVAQPDGGTATVYLRGDERRHWHADGGGYLVMRDPATRAWVYAVAQGRVVTPTRHRVGRDDPAAAGLSRYTPGTDAQAAPRVTSPARVPRTGTLRNLVVLVNFTDLTISNTSTEFDALFNQTNYTVDGATGSVRDYYQAVSGSRLTIASTVVGPVTVSNGYAYYGANNDAYAQQMVQEALVKVEASGFDFSAMDGDGDGWVDGLTIIHAGGGEEYGGNDPNYIWSHAWGINPVSYDGVSLSSYHTEPARRGWDSSPGTWGITRIGVICHELGHALGLPDLYDYGYDSRGVGGFCLMAFGSWGNSGATPVLMSAWCKYALDWATPTPVAAAGTFTVPADGATVYRVQGNFPATEYFLIENRQGTGFDASLPGATRGLLIWHVDELMGGNDDQTHYKVDLEEASGAQHLQLNADDGDDSDYFRADTMASLLDTTTPNSRSYGNLALGIGITQISAAGAVMTFTTTTGPTGNRPPVARNLAVRVPSGGTVYDFLPANDPEADRLTFRVVQPPASGTTKLLNPVTGYFSYRLKSTRVTADSFTFRASDGKMDSNIATVTITVNNKPVAYSTAITVKIGATYTGTLRVTDADWDELSFTYLTSPRHGMLTMRDFAGGFSYTPTTTRATTDSFSFRVNDGCENSAIATVRISIVK